jgi:hypothetical protein
MAQMVECLPSKHEFKSQYYQKKKRKEKSPLRGTVKRTPDLVKVQMG